MLGRVHAIEAQSVPQEGAFVPYGYIGPVGVGLPNLTQNIKPPVKPQAEDEQGVGRAPDEQWESREHPVYDNPDFFLAQPQQFPESPSYRGGPLQRIEGISTVGAVMELNYYQQHQSQTSPGSLYADTTVPQKQAIPNNQLAVLSE